MSSATGFGIRVTGDATRFNAVEAAGLKWLKHEMTLSQLAGTAPYAGCGHFGKHSEAAAEYFSNFDWHDSLFQHTYPLMCELYFKGQRPPDQGTPEHTQKMRGIAKTAKLLTTKGATVQQGRWFQFTRRWRDFEKHVWFFLLALCYIGLHLRWW